MNRLDLSEVLFEKMNELVDYYPTKVKPIEEMLEQTGFFPGCKDDIHKNPKLYFSYIFGNKIRQFN